MNHQQILSLAKNGGWLDLRGTAITSLPEGLTVGGSLDLRGTPLFEKIGVSKAGGNNRNIAFAVMKPGEEPKVSLGCFVGTLEEARAAIRENYSEDEAELYISKVEQALRRYQEFYAQ